MSLSRPALALIGGLYNTSFANCMALQFQVQDLAKSSGPKLSSSIVDKYISSIFGAIENMGSKYKFVRSNVPSKFPGKFSSREEMVKNLKTTVNSILDMYDTESGYTKISYTKLGTVANELVTELSIYITTGKLPARKSKFI